MQYTEMYDYIIWIPAPTFRPGPIPNLLPLVFMARPVAAIS